MSGAATALQAAALARLRSVEGLSGVYPGPPLQATVPYATVEAGAEADWGHKNGEGREVRLAIGLSDRGERPERLVARMDSVEAALAVPLTVPGWQLVSLAFLRSRIARDGRGGDFAWSGLIEYRARMLAA
jgi:Protein of unknown function (DUF3168)